MNDFVRFAILGLATGSLYALLGLGLVVVHRASGVVNFSHAGIAMVSGYVYFDLRTNNWGPAPAVAAALASGAILGLLIYVLVIRQLGRSSGLTKGIATLAVLVILQAGSTARYGPTPQSAEPFLSRRQVDVLGATVSLDNLIILGIGVVLVLGLALAYRSTQFGRATTAVAENQQAYIILGRSAGTVAVANWMIGGFLAAVAGVLIIPLVTVTPTLSTSLLIPALAVALAGGFRSFGVTAVAGLFVGVAQSELTRFSVSGPLSHLTGLPTALPFLVIIAMLVVSGKGLPTRDFVTARLPRVVGESVRPIWIILWTAVAIILVQVVTIDWVGALTTSFIAAIMLASLVVVSGFAGQLSLAQVSIAGVGVLTASWLVAYHGWPMAVAALVGIAASLICAMLVGLPALRTRGVTLAVVTLGLADALNSMLFTRNDINNAGLGMDVGETRLFGLSIDELAHPRRYALFALGLLVLVIVMMINLRRSRTGRVLIAVRANERAAASLGVSVAGAKLYAFVVAGGIAAMSGLLAAWRLPFVLYGTSYDPFRSVNAVVAGTLGGIGYPSGAVVGGAVTELGGVGGKIVTNIGFGDWLALITGGLLLVNIVFNPDGIVPNTLKAFQHLRQSLTKRWLRQRAPSQEMERGFVGHETVRAHFREGTLLQVRDVVVRFGSTTAVDGVSIECRSGEVLGVIGPNGSGKTTLIDAISGFVPADGQVLLNGQALHGRPAHHRNRRGISRSFQSLELFEELNVKDNLLVGSEKANWTSWISSLVLPRRATPNAAVVAAIDEFDLADELRKSPNDLPYGKRRLLAISRALSTDPRVLILDEPAAGLGEVDRLELRRLVRRLADDWGMAIILIEHDVELVMDVSDRVVALEFGRKIAEGTPQFVRSHPEVLRSYLGEEDGSDSHTAPVLELPELNGGQK